MEVPENCRECPFGSTCPAGHYGAYRCKYAAEIAAKNDTRGEKV